jgi:hypothetical protein
MDDRTMLFLLNDAAGAVFGTEDFCLFLYSLVRMHSPKTIVELGTGLGISAFWMALAAKRNKIGHVWTVDDFEFFDRNKDKVEEINRKINSLGIVALGGSSADEYYSKMSRRFEFDSCLTFVKSRIELNQVAHFDNYPFGEVPIDLLFADIRHGPLDILALLGHFLARMSPSSSILIHSASTYWPSYLLLEQLVAQLNEGKIPAMLQNFCTTDLSQACRNRRFLLIHLTQQKGVKQNSAAWFKLEPTDLLPHPLCAMHGASESTRLVVE